MAKIFKSSANKPEQQLSAQRKRLKRGATVLGAVLAALPLKMSAHCYENTTGYYSNGYVMVKYPKYQATCLYYDRVDEAPIWYDLIVDRSLAFANRIKIPYIKCALVVLTNQLVSKNHIPGTNPDEVFLRREDIDFLPPDDATEKWPWHQPGAPK
jgi:hypothetical protein